MKGKFQAATQVLLPALSIGGQVLISMKHPEYGLILGLLSQPFWIYTTWKAYREAKQIGVFVNTLVFSVITVLGVINYWYL